MSGWDQVCLMVIRLDIQHGFRVEKPAVIARWLLDFAWSVRSPRPTEWITVDIRPGAGSIELIRQISAEFRHMGLEPRTSGNENSERILVPLPGVRALLGPPPGPVPIQDPNMFVLDR